MAISDKLEKYMEILGCSAHDLSVATGLSDSAISRYRNGSRVPDCDSQEFISLVKGLENLFIEAGINPPESIYDSLLNEIPSAGINKKEYARRLGILVGLLEISRSKIASITGYDASFITRVIRNERAPSDYISFTAKISKCMASSCTEVQAINDLSKAISCPSSSLGTNEGRALKIANYLLSLDNSGFSADSDNISSDKQESIGKFLSKLDEFDLDDYMKQIHFDKIKAISTPLKFSGSKHYSGVEGMKKAELEFIRRTVLSSSKDPVWEYSDLPMEELASDKKFSKNWMIGLAMMLKKGLNLHIIHDLNRPFNEMMLGLESWIPLYMTGLISPYYLISEPESDFQHLIRISGNCSLIGECSSKNLKTALFTLSSGPTDLKAAEARRLSLFSRALPLMDIYGEDKNNEFNALCQKERTLLATNSNIEPVTLSDDKNHYFKNIKITKYGETLVIISKMNAPEIHFVIRHPLLVEAIISLF
ncbi:MAG: hypothetical protein K5669_10515 [Lachnospiraceae bacterium]|nr:hypothetical protein [Lachnospiraceae bacterium]